MTINMFRGIDEEEAASQTFLKEVLENKQTQPRSHAQLSRKQRNLGSVLTKQSFVEPGTRGEVVSNDTTAPAQAGTYTAP
jgi:hypothetical protein